MKFDPTALARELLTAADRGLTVPSIASRYLDFDWEEAYRIAAELHRLRTARGEAIVGRKIGFTNRGIWPRYRATSPIWAPVYRHTLTDAPRGTARVSLAAAVNPKIEPEIAFGLRSPIRPGLRDPAKVLAHVKWMAPAFEIVHCHFPYWHCTPAESVADAALHFHLVVGRRVPLGVSLPNLVDALSDCRVSLSRAGETMDIGTGANALDHPALALAHLADLLAAQPDMPPLAAGEIIATGTLTAALPVKPGETWSSAFSRIDLPALKVTFTA